MKKDEQQESAELFVTLQKKRKEMGLENQPISGFERFVLGEALFGVKENEREIDIDAEIKKTEAEIAKLQKKLEALKKIRKI